MSFNQGTAFLPPRGRGRVGVGENRLPPGDNPPAPTPSRQGKGSLGPKLFINAFNGLLLLNLSLRDPPSPARSGLVFAQKGYSLYAVQQFTNSLTPFLLREDYFPLTLTLSPSGGEGKKWNRFNALWLSNPAASPTPSPPASGGEGWGEGGGTTVGNFLTGQRWDLGGFSFRL
jgi:hypothetical protein